MTSIANQLRATVIEFLAGLLTTQEFCARYEAEYNAPDEVEWTSIDEGLVFQELFDAVVWFSPFPEDRARYKGYIDEPRVEAAAQLAAKRLGLAGVQLR